MKKIVLVLTLFCSLFLLTGCFNKELKMSQEEIIKTLYDGIKEDEMPDVASTEITEDNIEGYLGKKYNIESGIASEAMITSIAHSVVVIKLKDGEDVQKIADEIETAAKDTLYRKWICVEAEEVEVDTFGQTIVLIMSNKELGEKIENNLDKLK